MNSAGLHIDKLERLTYSVAEAANILGISKSLLYKYIQEDFENQLQVKKIYGRILIPKKALEDFVNNG